ncbi:MAG TPA: maltose alpha-D-glucosyltransferase [Tepidiformaceae bacterium]|nr:maltose alpha-D-glucosyltransferase [Tepidiformaceae bacterium]
MTATPDTEWYKDAIIYEVSVRSFFDSNGDGSGDIPGLTSKLDYLVSLGVDTLWLLPFYASPLRDGGYDIADFRALHPDFGTIDDFQQFLNDAHDRGLRVITELVLNHTSDQHEWFQEARRDPTSPKRAYYVWSDTDTSYAGARIIFTDTERSNWTWDPEAGAYYWHRFFSHQPDLNYDNPAVQDEMLDVVKFWFDLGVDGLRLDAVPYLFEREGTNCENLPETHAFLKRVRRFVDENWPNRMLLAEANQWPEDVRPYFGDGDECHMAFHFPVMPRLFMALRREDRTPIVEIMQKTPPIPESTQWCIFLRNHDELTLEMVTDEERDYLYHEYARDPRMRLNVGIRRRQAPLVETSRRRMELLFSLLFSLPGTPVIYYGDELGMGDNIYLGDRDGVRTPMQWSADRNAGFSRADTQRLFLPPIRDAAYSYESVNVEAQERLPTSLLSWVKRILFIRKSFPAFGRGTLRFLDSPNPRVLVYLREYGTTKILVALNFSRFSQPAEIDLSEFAGWRPFEVFGRTPFPRIGELPYLLTFAPHDFYWFELQAEDEE